MINLLMTPSKRNRKRFNTLIITGPIKGTSWERLHKELGLESLCDRRWYRKLIFFVQ